jgi:hypothetical protein
MLFLGILCGLGFISAVWADPKHAFKVIVPTLIALYLMYKFQGYMWGTH